MMKRVAAGFLLVAVSLHNFTATGSSLFGGVHGADDTPFELVEEAGLRVEGKKDKHSAVDKHARRIEAFGGLALGSRAPAIELSSPSGWEHFALDDHLGKKPVFLIFGSFT